MTTLESLILAVLSATEARKLDALRLLRGEAELAMVQAVSKETEAFLTLKECARRLGVSGCSLWRWQVPKHELGGRPKFRMSEIEAYLRSPAFQARAAVLREMDRSQRQTNRK